MRQVALVRGYLSSPFHTADLFRPGDSNCLTWTPEATPKRRGGRRSPVPGGRARWRGRPAYHFTPPVIFPGAPDAYKKHAKQNYPYSYGETDLQKARQVMKEASYGPNNRYKFTFTVYQASSTWPDVGKLLHDNSPTPTST